jgi:hypothetical protein
MPMAADFFSWRRTMFDFRFSSSSALDDLSFRCSLETQNSGHFEYHLLRFHFNYESLSLILPHSMRSIPRTSEDDEAMLHRASLLQWISSASSESMC